MKKQNGITLIALVVTIIVLLILAGITMNIALNEGGIIAKAQSSKEKQEVAAMLDRLTVAEANTAVNYFAVDMEKYNEQLKSEGIANNSNYKLNADGKTYTLITGEYSFIISEPTPGDIVVNYEGKVDALKPRIIKFESTENTSNAIKVQVEVERLEEGNKKLTYQYKKQSETNYITLKENVAELTANYINLEQNQIYDLKVIAENRNGSSEMVISVVTGGIAEGTISQKGTTIWSNGKASVELQTTDTANTMQYQIGGINGNWLPYTKAIENLSYKDIIYARMWDGTNGNNPFSLEILDNEIPQTATINLSAKNAQANIPITATVTQTDNESGVDITKCKWIYNTTNTLIGNDETSYTGGSFTSNSQIINLTATTVETYYLHVLTIDKAGNKRETISEGVTINQLVTSITLNQTSAITYGGSNFTLIATANPSNATNKNVTWSSSNTNIATVTNGVVTGVGVGTATITATAQDGSGKTATCLVTVKSSLEQLIDSGAYVTGTSKTVKDKMGNQVVVPVGFKVTNLATTVQNGIVIQDSIGNQLTWIPVSNTNGNGTNKIIKEDGSQVEITLGRYKFNTSNGTPTIYQYGANYTQTVDIPDSDSTWRELSTFRESNNSNSLSGTNTTAKNLGGFIQSANINKGYYIARYEASYASGSSSANQTPFSKQSTSCSSDGYNMSYITGRLWNYVTQYDASRICRNMYSNGYLESDLINSYAWDTAILFIQKCSSNTNYANRRDGYGSIRNTGTTGDVACNIYDLSSNLFEFTTEYTPYAYYDDGQALPTTSRGSYYANTDFLTQSRVYNFATTKVGFIGFRAIMYLP